MKSKLTVIILFLFAISYSQTVLADTQGEGKLITIPNGINIVLKDSRLLKISLFDEDIASQDALLARSALLPQINASVKDSYLNHQPTAKFGSQSVPTAQKESLSFGFDVYQTLFDFGKSLANYKAAGELVYASRANIESVKRIAILEFIIAYFDLLEAEKMITVAEKEAESLGSYLNDIEHLFENGAATKNDLLPAKVRLADAKRKLITARNSREISAIRLNNILSLPLREKIGVQDIDMELPQVPLMDHAWNTAQAERPEIKVIDERIAASIFVQKSKAVENYPQLFAQGGYQYNENKYMVYQDNMYFNLGAKANIFNGGASTAGLSKERFKEKQLLQQREKLVEDIKFEVEDSYLALKDAGEKLSVAKDSRAQAEENVRVNRVKYNEGSATTTDVIEAITLETNAQTNFYNAGYELKRSYAKLMYSMGIDLTLIYNTMKRGDK
jgi:outer membrane protein